MQVLRQSPEIVSPYLKYLRETFFSSFSPPEGFTDYQAPLFRISERLMEEQSQHNELSIEAPGNPIAKVDRPVSSSQLQYSGKRSSIALTLFGPNYIALLSVCSLKTWLAPHLLAEVSFMVSQLCMDIRRFAVEPF